MLCHADRRLDAGNRSEDSRGRTLARGRAVRRDSWSERRHSHFTYTLRYRLPTYVLLPPTETTVRLPAPKNGQRFRAASLLASGKEARIRQSADGIELSLPPGVSWDPVDTVIALKVDPSRIQAGTNSKNRESK